MSYNRNLIASALMVLIMPALAACTPNDTTFGGAARHNYAAQIVNPDPQYDDTQLETDGTKAGAAVERYRTDKVKKPVGVKTTNSTGGSSSPN